MATLTYLRARINFYKDSLYKTRNKKRQKEDEYSNLSVVKRSVSRKQSDFSRANKAKLKTLESVAKYSKNNSFAKKYYNRMNSGVMRVGNRIVVVGFKMISNNLEKEARKIQNEINSYARDIEHCNRKIRELERQYEEERRRQTQIGSSGGGFR